MSIRAGRLVDQSDRETSQVQEAYEERHMKRREHLRVLVRPGFSCPPLLFFLLIIFSDPISNDIKYRYNRVDQNSRAYYSTDFHHLRAHRRSIDIAAVLRADRRQTIRSFRNSAILLTSCAGCVRVVRERQVPNVG